MVDVAEYRVKIWPVKLIKHPVASAAVGSTVIYSLVDVAPIVCGV